MTATLASITPIQQIHSQSDGAGVCSPPGPTSVSRDETDAQIAFCLLDRRDQFIGLGKIEGERLFNEHRLAHFERLHNGQRMFELDRRDDDRIHLRPRYDFQIVRRMKLCAGARRELLRARRVAVGHGKKFYGRVRRRHDGAERADAPRTNDGDT